MYEIHMGERNTWKRVRARRSEREKEEESECEMQRYERRKMRGATSYDATRGWREEIQQ